MKKKINYGQIALLIIAPILLISKLFQFYLLPEKYFYDSNLILGYMNKMPDYVDGSYRFVSNLFKKINYMNFTTIQEWSILITCCFFWIVLIIINHRKKYIDFMNVIYISCATFLLGVYIFNIGKDIVQFVIFLFAAMIISTRYIKYDIIKLIIVAVIFFIESNIFRSYYILVSVFAIYFYFILTYVQNKNKKISLKEVIFIIVVTLLMIYIFMKFAEKFKPDEYKNLMTVRDRTNGNREGSEDAVTMISELLPTNGNLNMWMINYIINAVRILIPVELIAKGAKYLPFVIYQIISDYYLVKAILDINANKNPLKTISVCVFCAYLITSFAFEPDFGSFVRHETACFPVFVNIVIEEKYVRVPNDSKYIIKRSFNNVFKRNRHK